MVKSTERRCCGRYPRYRIPPVSMGLERRLSRVCEGMAATASPGIDTDRIPDPDPRQPDSPTDLTKPPRFFALRNTVREFQEDQCTDLAAALTYYAVLSLFPALLVMISLLGVFGQGRRTTDAVLD